MFSIRRFPLVQQTLIGVLALCLLIAIPLSIALYAYVNSVVQHAAASALQTQTDLISFSLEYAEKNMQQDALTALERLKGALPPARLTGGAVKTDNGLALPELMFGDTIRGIGNQAYLLDYKEKNPSDDAAFLVAMGGALYRGSTLLKDGGGRYRDAEIVSDDYARTVLAGSRHVGTIQRSGNLYALAVEPVMDGQGRIIGALNMRVSVAESVRALKERMERIVLGRTGYPFIISMPVGDQKEARLVLHPILGDRPLGGAPAENRAIFDRILEQKTGSMLYTWHGENGVEEERIAVFREIPALHWIIVAVAPMEEYTVTYDNITHGIVVGLAGMALLLVLCLWWLVRRQLRPIGGLIEGLVRMGEGDLSEPLATMPDSRNEIDLLAVRINGTREAMKKLVGAIRESSTTVTSAAAAALGDMHNLSDNVDQLSSTTAQVNRSIEELSAAIGQVTHAAETASARMDETADKVTHGKEVVQGVIDSIHAVENRVHSSLAEVERLTEHSRKIETVVASIGAIAGQTNLLALNAAIEAARAGEVGRGFAVVADEVRKLAEQSANSADEIGKILSEITIGVDAVRAAIAAVVAETHEGAQASGSAGEALEGIAEITRVLIDNVNIITSSAAEQAQAAQSMTGQVAASVQIAGATDKVTRDVSQTAAALKAEADKLDREVGYFKV
ncbi:MAG: methyl-accepting chemotaxis protein [Azoarcus sp.]|nr:methyl-accepting chemotaxis protein [Azoarcus sp.]